MRYTNKGLDFANAALLLLVLPFIWTRTYSATLDTLVVLSKSMNKEIRNVVILPESYNASDKTFPVLYALHGAGGNYKSWIKQFPEIKILSDKYNIIIICPDGGKTSWYFDSPIDKNYKYETYIVSELIDAIDRKYKTINDKSSRAIMGYSMGGHGAFYLAFKHPEKWGVAISTSGGLDLRPFPKEFDISKRLGDLKEFPDNWDKNSVINLIHLLDGKNMNIFFDCGINDFFYEVNRRFHEKLIQNRIPHTYMERPGSHTGDYWKTMLKYHFAFLEENLVGVKLTNKSEQKQKIK